MPLSLYPTLSPPGGQHVYTGRSIRRCNHDRCSQFIVGQKALFLLDIYDVIVLQYFGLRFYDFLSNQTVNLS